MDGRETFANEGGPPHPHFALSIGVIGHRPNRLPPNADKLRKIRTDIEQALDLFIVAAQRAHADQHTLFSGSGETLTLVSALAEGADSMAARAAIVRALKLDVVLPFPVGEYEKDFVTRGGDAGDVAAEIISELKTELAIDEFEDLIMRARSVLSLPGSRGPSSATKDERALAEGRSYEAAGLTILSQSDVVLAVWDGKPSQGRGGTPELIAEAARIGIPIVIVDANGVRPPEVRWRNFRALPGSIVNIQDLPRNDLNTGLHQVVDELVRPPDAHEQRHALKRWFRETRSWINVRIGYPAVMALLWTRRPRRTDLFPAKIGELERNYRIPANEFLAAEAHADNQRLAAISFSARRGIEMLAKPYGWADSVAVQTAQLFRSAFVFNFIFAALAIMVAAYAVIWMHEHPDPPAAQSAWEAIKANWLVVLEVLLIASVVANTLYGHRAEWHRRWYEARELAERLRVALPLWAVGLRPGSFPGEEPTWTGWYTRAFVRMQGLRPGTLTGEGMQSARSLLLNVLREQCRYNAINAHRISRVDLRLELVGLATIVAIVVLAIDHVFLESSVLARIVQPYWPVHESGIWLSVALPALASAIYGIRVIGDFEGIHRRAERTQDILARLIAAIEEDPDDLTLLRARASSAADAMLGDVSSWRLSAESRGLAIPG